MSRALAAELRLPLVAKDDVKEALFDALGHGDVARSNELGAASFEVLFRVAAGMLAAGVSCIVEGNFSRPEPFRALPPARVVQLLCGTSPPELASERYAGRDRHPGHVDRARDGEVSRRIAAGEWGWLELEGERIAVDTTHSVDVEALAQTLSP